MRPRSVTGGAPRGSTDEPATGIGLDAAGVDEGVGCGLGDGVIAAVETDGRSLAGALVDGTDPDPDATGETVSEPPQPDAISAASATAAACATTFFTARCPARR